MATQLEYALIAGAAYVSTRADINKIPVPQGWQEIPDSHVALPSGFEAISFQQGNEIVISFAGTGQWVDAYSDIGLVLGIVTEQLKQAALYYEQVKTANPDAQISFTGHSLGGGLASLMGVFFNKTAVTFDSMPVRSAASMSVRDSIASYLLANGGITDVDLADFTSDIGVPDDVPPGIRGEDKVTGLYVEGEVASYIPLYKRIGTQTPLPNGNSGLTDLFLSIDLHSQALLTAYQQHDSFRAVTFKLPNMVRLIFDSALYKNPTSSDDRNFLEHLVRHQAGVPGLFDADAMLTHFTNDMGDIAQARGQAVDNVNLNKSLIAFGLQAYYEQTDAFTKETYEEITGGVRFDRAMIAGDLDAIKGYGLYFLPYLQNRFSSETLSLITSQLPTLQDWFIASGAGDATALAGDRTAFMLGADKQDQFTGGSRNDLIIGDAGNDILDGGAGNDYLAGGAGFDTYVVQAGSGNDVIIDDDGHGLLRYVAGGHEQNLVLGIHETGDPAGQYQSPDGQFTFNWSGTPGTDLAIQTAGGSITVKDFTDGNLGIRFVEEPSFVPQTVFTASDNDDVNLLDFGLSPTIAGGQVLGYASNRFYDRDNYSYVTDFGYANIGEVFNTRNSWDAIGNVYFHRETFIPGTSLLDTDRALYGLGGNDYLVGYAGAREILLDGGLGSDWIIADYGEVYNLNQQIGTPEGYKYFSDYADYSPGFGATIEGGDGHDAIQGSYREDWIEAGTGHDQVQGGEENDYIDGGSGNDWIDGSKIDGSADDDILIGGPDSLTAGASDNDVLMGGAGKDILIGGAGNDILYGDADGYSMRRLIKVSNYSITYPLGYPVLTYGRPSYGIIGWDGATGSYVIPSFDDSERTVALYKDAQGAGDDYLDGGAGQDQLFGGAGNDVLDGGTDSDKLYGEGGGDELHGGAGDDELWGDINPLVYAQDRQIIETHGNLSIFTRQYLGGPDVFGNDILEGGAGNDALHGGAGDDTYFFNLGDGRDTIEDNTTPYESNLVVFGDGIHFEDIAAALNGDTLVLQIGTGGDSISLLHFDINTNHVVDYLQFFDRGLASVLDFVPHSMDGDEGGNAIYGNSQDNFIDALGGDDRVATYVGDDTIAGGKGNDVLEGGIGNDTYIFNLGDGIDTIIDESLSGEGNRISFGEGITPDSLSLGLSSLLIHVGDAGDAIRLTTFDPNNVYGPHSIGSFEFADGTILSYEQLIDRGFDFHGTEANDAITGTDGIDRITGGQDNDSLHGGNGNDTLDGGVGDDQLYGGDGADSYAYRRGDGNDIINDSGVQGIINAVVFGEDIALSDLVFVRTGNDLLIKVTDPTNSQTTDQINIQGSYSDLINPHIGQFGFADGTVLDGRLALMIATYAGTPGSRILQGGSADEVIHGSDGNNYLFGDAGDDLIDGAGGADYLAGETGNDTLIGGSGADTLDGGIGDDIYIYNFGDGADTILDTDGLGRIIYRDAQGTEHLLDGGARVSTGTYYEENGRFAYSLNSQTLTVTLDGQAALTIQNFDLAATSLGVALRTYYPPQIHITSDSLDPIRVVNTAVDGGLGNFGGRMDDSSFLISADGRYVTFSSGATNLVPGDTNNAWDVFVKDIQTGAIIRASTTENGTQANGGSGSPSISADGRYVVFTSGAANLVSEDTNNSADVFLKDLQTGAVFRANTAANGSQAYSYMPNNRPSVSADGRYVAFESMATNLVPGDTNRAFDIFVKDLQTGAIIRANTAANGTETNIWDMSREPSISADGRYVVFTSGAANLVSGDTNGVEDVFVKNLQTGAIRRANTTASGGQGNGGTGNPTISADGRYVAFWSAATNLVTGDTNKQHDIFVKDLQTGAIIRASTGADGTQSNNWSFSPSLSTDGRYVTFWSEATNLVEGDTNGRPDIFIKDLQTGNISRVSVAANGTQQNGESLLGTSISADGQYVVFTSNDANLVAGDTNSTWDVFVAPNPLLPLVTYANVPMVLSSISALDSDAGTEPLSISLSVNRGSLVLLNTEGITFTDIDGRDGILTFSGALANLNAALDAGILYTPAINYVGNDTLKIAINDQSFGAGLTDDATVALAVISASGTEPAVIVGTSGNDVLIGGSSNNTLIGEVGDDVLIGGIGNDTYLYNLGDGSDLVLDLDQSPGNVDTLSFGFDITPDSLSADASGLNLLVHIGDETLAIQNWFLGSDYQIERIEFESGASYDGSWLVSLGSHAPDLVAPLPDRIVDEDNSFSLTPPPGTFTDQDIVNGDALSYSAVLSDGSVLPAWFSLDTSTGTLFGLADNSLVGSYDIIVTATDSDGQSISDTFTLSVNNTNDAPIVANSIADKTADEDSPFSFTLDNAAFGDDDFVHGDVLSLSAILADDSALPDWIIFDATTGTFTAILDNEEVGTYQVRVTATDLMGDSVSDVFALAVNNTNDIPIVVGVIGDQETDEDVPFVFALSAGVFADDDIIHGDTLILSAALVDGSILPTWLSFDAATGTFSGTPDNWQVGSYDIQVTATDIAGTSASDVFTLTVNNVNDNPILANALGDFTTDEDAPFSFTVPPNTFFDDDFIHGDSLTISAALADGSVLPDWLTFDASTGTFTGTPDNWDVGNYDIRVTATDTAGISVFDDFVLTVNNTNDAPVLATAITDQLATEGTALAFTLAAYTFHDDDAIHGDVLSYAASLADGSALPAWLTFDTTTQTLTGTATTDSTLIGTDGDDVLVDTDTGISGTWDIQVTATDTSGISAEDVFTLTLQGVAGNDTLNGGKGNDVLNGGGGNDTYIYNQGDGLDTLTDREGQDTVAFGEGYSFVNTVIRTEGNIAHLRFLDNDGCETGEGMDITDGTAIESFIFADGSTHTLNDLHITAQTWYGDKKANTIITGRNDDTVYAGKGGDTVYARTGNDTLYGDKGNDKLYGEGGDDRLYGGKGDDLLDGGCGDDTLDGGKGHNTLIGGAGNDTLILGDDGENTIYFNQGDGWDTLKTTTKDEGHDNEVRFGQGITQQNLWFTRSGNNLTINVLGTSDGMTVEDWYSNKHKPIEEFKTANGYELEDKQVALLVQAMASFTPVPGSVNALPTEMPESFQPVLAAAWEAHG